MKTFTLRAAAVIGLFTFAATRPALAATYSDGGTHTVSGTDTNDVVSNGTTVNVVTGANITGSSIDPFGTTAISVSGSTSSLNVSGGSITGGSGSHFGASGLTASDGNFNISGGSFSGGSSSGTTPTEAAGNGASFSNFQSLTISAGNFLGGTGYVNQDGYGLQITGGSAPAMISGGVFGGNSSASLNLAGSAVADISGAQFVTQSLSQGTSVANVSGNVTDGPFGGGVWSFQDSSALNLSNGTLSPPLNFFNNSQLNVTGGVLSGTTLNDSSVATVSAGQLAQETTLLDNSVFNLKGGTIEAFIPSFYLANSAVLNVYGTNLALVSQGGPYWGLSGTLADGTVLPSDTQLEIFNSAIVNLIQTPEPSALTLAALGLLCLAGRGWRRQPAPRA